MKLKRKEIPAIDDELAKDASEFDTFKKNGKDIKRFKVENDHKRLNIKWKML